MARCKSDVKKKVMAYCWWLTDNDCVIWWTGEHWPLGLPHGQFGLDDEEFSKHMVCNCKMKYEERLSQAVSDTPKLVDITDSRMLCVVVSNAAFELRNKWCWMTWVDKHKKYYWLWNLMLFQLSGMGGMQTALDWTLKMRVYVVRIRAIVSNKQHWLLWLKLVAFMRLNSSGVTVLLPCALSVHQPPRQHTAGSHRLFSHSYADSRETPANN
jgi:hypothetical protein